MPGPEDDFTVAPLRRSRFHPMVGIVIFALLVGAAAGLADSELAPAGTGAGQAPPAGLGAVRGASVQQVSDRVDTTVLSSSRYPDVPSGPVSCGDVQHCVAAATEETMADVLVTANGGRSWSAEALPGTAGSSLQVGALSCASAARCLLAGQGPRGPVVYETGDGGRRWEPGHLPSGLASVTALACPTSSTCYVAGAGPATPSGSALLARSGDGGRHWDLLPRPHGIGAISSLSCPTARACFVEGTGLAASGGAAPGTVVSGSSDGGRHFHDMSLAPGGLEVGSNLSCPSANACTLIAASTAATTSPAVLVRSDGPGLAFRTVATLPRGAGDGRHAELACASPSSCVVAPSIDSTTLSGVLATTDAGRSWSHLGSRSGGRIDVVRSLDCTRGAGHGRCLATWFSLLPAEDGISSVAAAALAPAGPVRQVSWTYGLLPPGSPPLEVSCSASGECVWAAIGTATAWFYSAGERSATEVNLARASGVAAATVEHLSCTSALCGVSVVSIGRGRAARQSFVGRTAGPRAAVFASARVTMPLSSFLECDTPSVCVRAVPARRDAAISLSGDGARTWETSTPGFRSSRGEPLDGALVACAGSASRCMAVAVRGGHPSPVELAGTRDGGRHWTLEADGSGAFSASRARPLSLACDAAGECALDAASGSATLLSISPGLGKPFHLTVMSGRSVGTFAGLQCGNGTCEVAAQLGRKTGILSTTGTGARWRFTTARSSTSQMTGREASLSPIAALSPTACVVVDGTATGQKVELVRFVPGG